MRNGVIPTAPATAPVPDTATMDANGLAHSIGARQPVTRPLGRHIGPSFRADAARRDQFPAA